MNRPIIAVDCDLHKVYAWCSVCGEVCKAHPNASRVIAHAVLHMTKETPSGTFLHAQDEAPIVLMEVASPVSGVRKAVGGNAINYNLLKWVIFNSMIAQELEFESTGSFSFRVAPSDVWTKGFDLKKRHKLCRTTAKQKDLRECESMIYMYCNDPSNWLPLSVYRANL